MTYVIGWSDGQATVSIAAEAEAVLDRIAANPDGPYLVHIAPEAGDDSMIELVWGHPERAMLMYADDEFGGWAIDNDLPPWPEDLGYDHGAVEPARTRLTAGQARQAVAWYVTTGQRPTGVDWMAG